MSTVDIRFIVDPLGSMRVKWKIPSEIATDVVNIPLPSFKYDLPRLGGIPVPISSKAIALKASDIKVNLKSDQYTLKLKKNFEGKVFLSIKVFEIISAPLILKYTIREIVNNDSVYFIAVYPFTNPFSPSTKFNIELEARFSFNIRVFKFREWYFNKRTGKRLNKKLISKSNKQGDLIKVSFSDLTLDENTELDIHLTGTRFPIMIRRDLFWYILFFISIVIISSPIWSAFLR